MLAAHLLLHVSGTRAAERRTNDTCKAQVLRDIINFAAGVNLGCNLDLFLGDLHLIKQSVCT